MVNSFQFRPLSTVPAPYSIVWCRFPYKEAPGQPGIKERPAIVRQAFADDENQPWVNVVYGTSRNTSLSSPGQFVIANLADMDSCGLHKATRFNLLRCEQLPWSQDFFTELPGYQSPVIGQLTPYLIRLIQIEADFLKQRGLL